MKAYSYILARMKRARQAQLLPFYNDPMQVELETAASAEAFPLRLSTDLLEEDLLQRPVPKLKKKHPQLEAVQTDTWLICIPRTTPRF